VHIGDSRAYLFRDDKLTQITHDHTFVQALVDEGRITADEASSHPQRSLILRVLTGNDVEPDYSVREAVVGDRYLICSDGLSGVLSEETIEEALKIEDPAEAADQLIDLALRGGGPDNITVIVSDIVEGYGEGAPVAAGAVTEGRGQQDPKPTSAAARAALARPARPRPPDEPPVDAPRGHRRSLVLGSLVALVVVAALGLISWWYLQHQYYVGASKDGRVSVLRGVSGSVSGVSLHSVAQESNIRLDDLQPVTRRQVLEGIQAADRPDADRILTRLNSQLLPLCRTAPVASPSPSPTPKATPRASTRPTTGSSARPSTRPSVRPSPSPSPSPSPKAQVPGRDCRKQHS
jgi:protein phosphatase